MHLISLAAFSALASAALSSTQHHVVHESRAPAPHGWIKSRKLETDKVLPMRFGLTQQNVHRIEEMLMAVAHPDSPTYSQHYSAAQIVDIFSPSQETIETVMNWLTDAGISRERLGLSPNKGWIHLNATVSEIEGLLKTEYHIYTHSSGDQLFGCQNYAVPVNVKEHIELIHPTVNFNPRPFFNRGLEDLKFERGSKQTDTGIQEFSQDSLDTCDELMTLACLRALYSIDYELVSTEKNTFAVVGITPGTYLGSDLDLFFRKYAPRLIGTRPNTVLIDVGSKPHSPSHLESSLDLEYAMGYEFEGSGQLGVVYARAYVGGSFGLWLDAVDASFCTFEGGDESDQDGIYPDPFPGGFKGPETCGIISPPSVISVSYGQDEVSGSFKYLNRQCNEYAKLGLMGTTVFYSSGDTGVAGTEGICLNSTHMPVNSTTNISHKNGTVFNPSFPSSCPFITSVGATQINPGSTIGDPESACEQTIFSGGGFSNIFSMPSYQADAVTHFLTAHPPPYHHGEFNNTGRVRGFPDISANGANYVIASDGQLQPVFGTSASTPVVASMFTMINDARISIGKKTVGFINPAIYSPFFQSAFNDITTGGNQGCGTPGFNAARGWDPVTGVGTPDLSRLLPIFMALP